MKLYLAFIAMMVLVGSVHGATIVVCPGGCNYSSIQRAIDASHSGDTIAVCSGTYNENVYVSRDVTLRGVDTGTGRPVIDARGAGSVITLYADKVTLQGFNVTGSGSCGCGNSGIKIMSNNSTIFDNVVWKNKYGIYCNGYIGNKIYLNNLVDNNITAYDTGRNQWFGPFPSTAASINVTPGQKAIGNHYSDFDKPGKGCNDTNRDGICDSPRNILGGSNVDRYAMTSAANIP
jgi:hypothetical protein